MSVSVIVDLGFGDSGKGVWTNFLCNNGPAAVIRYCGGQNAGHTVIHNNIRHVFSNFGSGTLQGASTFWSKYCSICPEAFSFELKLLKSKGITPKIFVDPLCPVTTPYDIEAGRFSEKKFNHGSTGTGFGATIRRDDVTPYKLYAGDLLNPNALGWKLNAIKSYYGFDVNDQSFAEQVSDMMAHIVLIPEVQWFNRAKSLYKHLIFEGAQGVLLDMDHGFFPHVTYSNTTSKNALEIIKRNHLGSPKINYLTRAYQTRHGNGPMTNEALPHNILESPMETNIYNQWQGLFRKSLLDIDLLHYAIGCDENYSAECEKSMVISCVDQINGDFTFTKNGTVHSRAIKDCFREYFPYMSTFAFSFSPDGKSIDID